LGPYKPAGNGDENANHKHNNKEVNMNSVDTAIKMKMDAVKYYEEASERCDHPAGKKMFLTILEDEKEHLESLKQAVKEMKIDVNKLNPIQNVKTSLESIKDQMRESTACSLDEMEVFKIAMDMEKECVDFYRREAEEAESEDERALFRKLAAEEEEHFRIFSNTHSYLSDSGNWFMWDDHSIVEG
jgi:rubrerythrin